MIGVLGPRRMDYKKVLKTIKEIGEGISDMIGDVDAENLLKEMNNNGGEQSGG